MVTKKKPATVLQLNKALLASTVIFCQDVIVAKDETLSLIRLIDQIGAPTLPIRLDRFCFVIEFTKARGILDEDLAKAGIVFEVIFVEPDAKHLLGETTMDFARGVEKTFHRLIAEIPGLAFQKEGLHSFQLRGKLGDKSWLLAEKQILVKLQPR